MPTWSSRPTSSSRLPAASSPSDVSPGPSPVVALTPPSRLTGTATRRWTRPTGPDGPSFRPTARFTAGSASTPATKSPLSPAPGRLLQQPARHRSAYADDHEQRRATQGGRDRHHHLHVQRGSYHHF